MFDEGKERRVGSYVRIGEAPLRVGTDDDHGNADPEPRRRRDVIVEAAAVVVGNEDGGCRPLRAVLDSLDDLPDPVVTHLHRVEVVLRFRRGGGHDRDCGQGAARRVVDDRRCEGDVLRLARVQAIGECRADRPLVAVLGEARALLTCR